MRERRVRVTAPVVECGGEARPLTLPRPYGRGPLPLPRGERGCVRIGRRTAKPKVNHPESVSPDLIRGPLSLLLVGQRKVLLQSPGSGRPRLCVAGLRVGSGSGPELRGCGSCVLSFCYVCVFQVSIKSPLPRGERGCARIGRRTAKPEVNHPESVSPDLIRGPLSLLLVGQRKVLLQSPGSGRPRLCVAGLRVGSGSGPEPRGAFSGFA